jgi:hypothetical protein
MTAANSARWYGRCAPVDGSAPRAALTRRRSRRAALAAALSAARAARAARAAAALAARAAAICAALRSAASRLALTGALFAQRAAASGERWLIVQYAWRNTWPLALRLVPVVRPRRGGPDLALIRSGSIGSGSAASRSPHNRRRATTDHSIPSRAWGSLQYRQSLDTQGRSTSVQLPRSG